MLAEGLLRGDRATGRGGTGQSPLTEKIKPPLAIISGLVRLTPPCNHFSAFAQTPYFGSRMWVWEAKCGVFRAYWVEDSETAPSQSFPNSPHLLPPPMPLFSVRDGGFGSIPSFSIFRNIKRNDCHPPPPTIISQFPSPSPLHPNPLHPLSRSEMGGLGASHHLQFSGT